MMPRGDPETLDHGRLDEDTETTFSILKYLPIWEEGESSSPLMDRSNQSLNMSDHSLSSHSSPVMPPTSPKPQYSLTGSQKKHTETSTRRQHVGGEYELKNAREALIGSISAVINFLRTSGVPKPACDQLLKNLQMNRYFATMKRVQDYVQCLPATDEDAIMARIHLTVTAWKALCQLKTIEYQRAYKWSSYVRLECEGSSETDIQAAIALQVKQAEQCSACQKKLYSVEKWQKYWLTKLNRSTMIEPEGYHAIPCQ
jgi:hypothetical protein